MNELLTTESAVIAGMLSGRDGAGIGVVRLSSVMFSHDDHRILFDAISQLYSSGLDIDPITVNDQLEAMSADADAFALLKELTPEAYTWANIESYIEILIAEHRRRQWIRVGASIVQMSESHTSPDDISARVRQAMMDDAHENLSAGLSTAEQIGEWILTTIHHWDDGMNTKAFMPTGIYSLDRRIQGFQAGELIIIAGYTSMGKTALAIQIIANIAEKYRAHMFSMEMTEDELGLRFTEVVSGIPVNEMMKTRQSLTMDQDASLTLAAQKIMGWKFSLTVQGGVTVDQIRRVLQAADATDDPIKAIVVDYLQLMRLMPGDSQNLRVAETTKALKALAIEYHVRMIVLSQLSRPSDRNIIRMPTLANLRDSGAIEQDANKVIFVHRDRMNQIQDEQEKTTLNVAKNRNGSTGYVFARYNLETQQFKEI